MSKPVQKVVVLGGPSFIELVQLIDGINKESDIFFEVIAILDDNPDIRLLVSNILKEKNFLVLVQISLIYQNG